MPGHRSWWRNCPKANGSDINAPCAVLLTSPLFRTKSERASATILLWAMTWALFCVFCSNKLRQFWGRSML